MSDFRNWTRRRFLAGSALAAASSSLDSGGSARAGTAESPTKQAELVIDVHHHVAATGMDNILLKLDRAGIGKVYGIAPNPREGDWLASARIVLDAMKRYPDRVIGGYFRVYSPYFGKELVTALEDAVAKGLRGLKLKSWESVRQPSLYRPPPLDDPSYHPVIGKAVELKIPILAHCPPVEAEGVARQFPGAILLMAHSGGGDERGDWQRAILAAERFPNIYLETSSSVVDAGFIEEAVDAVGPERIVFGTDMPLLDPFVQIAKIRGAKVSLEDKRLILGGNMARIIGYSGA